MKKKKRAHDCLGMLLGVLAPPGIPFDKSKFCLAPLNIRTRRDFIETIGKIFDAAIEHDMSFQITFVSGIKCLGPVKQKKRGKNARNKK